MEILEKLKEIFPKGSISKIELEASEIIVYTKNKEFFLNYEPYVKEAVSQLKKRIEVRAEKELLMEKSETKKKIQEIVPKEAQINKIYFEPERSIVIISAVKPGLVIGKGAENLKKIKKSTFWTPRVERIPPIKSDVVAAIRKMMHTEIRFRKKFLNNVGKRIFEKRETNRKWVRIIGLGGWGEVGRSCTLVETPKSKVLIDCGISVGGKDPNTMYPYLYTKEFDPNEIDAIILSHAHLDHCGMIPYLYEMGYDGPLYATTPTIDLFALLSLDYIDVLQKSGKNPIYTAKGVKEAVRHAIMLEYNEVTDISPDIRLTFQNAGHILGSALVHLHIGNGLHNILYALDQKFGRSNLLEPASTNFQRVETLIIESTYGAKEDVMPPRAEVEKQLMEVVNRTMERNGIVLIPSFSVERAQEVMVILAKHGFSYPVYLDGMIWDANGIFTAYPEYLSKYMQKLIFSGNDPFTNPIFKRITTRQEREKVWEDRPCVIISTSGMLVGGPAIEHLKHLGGDERNTLVFVGFQAEGTLGRRIQRGLREIPFENDEGKTEVLELKMEVVSIEGLSGHSDRRQLLAYVNNLPVKPRKIILVHGDYRKMISLQAAYQKLFGIETYRPINLESIRVV